MVWISGQSVQTLPISDQKYKNHTLWCCTYLYTGLYKGVPLPPPSTPPPPTPRWWPLDEIMEMAVRSDSL